jgi:hypothetical protein
LCIGASADPITCAATDAGYISYDKHIVTSCFRASERNDEKWNYLVPNVLFVLMPRGSDKLIKVYDFDIAFTKEAKTTKSN